MTDLRTALAALVHSDQAEQFRNEASRGIVGPPYASNRYVRLLDAARALLAEHPADVPPSADLRFDLSRPALGSSEQQRWAVAVLDDGSEVRMRVCGSYAEIRTWDEDERCRPPALAVGRVGPHVIDVRVLPADLPVATDSTTAGFVERRTDGHDCETSGACCSTCKTHDGCSCPPAPEPSDRAGLSETEREYLRARRARDGEPS